jgi:hypothetical protein
MHTILLVSYRDGPLMLLVLTFVVLREVRCGDSIGITRRLFALLFFSLLLLSNGAFASTVGCTENNGCMQTLFLLGLANYKGVTTYLPPFLLPHRRGTATPIFGSIDVRNEITKVVFFIPAFFFCALRFHILR